MISEIKIFLVLMFYSLILSEDLKVVNINEKISLLRSCYRHYGMVLVDFFRLPKVRRYKDKIIVNIPSESIVSMIDEIPAYAIVSCFSKGNTSLINASELRIKESDRIASLCSHLLSANVNIQESTDGFSIKPKNKLYNTIKIDSDDHRIIMASEIFNLIVSGDFSGDFTDKISISFPDFYSIIKRVIK